MKCDGMSLRWTYCLDVLPMILGWQHGCLNVDNVMHEACTVYLDMTYASGPLTNMPRLMA